MLGKNSILQKASKYYSEMEFLNAIHLLENYSKENNLNFKASLLLARSYDQLALITNDVYRKKKYQDKAIKICNELLNLRSGSVDLLINIGNVYHHLALDNPKYNETATNYYQRALSLAKSKSDKVECLNNLGNSLQRMGDFLKALNYYNQGYILSRGKSASILFNLSFVCLKLSDWQGSLRYSHEYVKQAANFPKNKMQEMFQRSIKNNVDTAMKFLSSFTDK